MNKSSFWRIAKYFLSVGYLTLYCACNPAAESQTVTFAIASDFHAPDIPDGEERIAAFVQAAQQHKSDFIIELGDYCRLDSTNRKYHQAWNRFAGDRYHVIGNHDMDHCTPQEYVDSLQMPARYYSFDKGQFHFIVLDGNNLFDGSNYTHYAHANYYAHPQQREYIDAEQMEWLKTDLASTNKRCILFSHQSIDATLRNGEAVRTLLEQENQRAGFRKVVLAFSGHTHTNYSKQINGITYYQINSASYAWIGDSTHSEKRYPQEVNQRYGHNIWCVIPYNRPLYAVVTLTPQGAQIKGVEAQFMPPTPKELNLPDSLFGFPLVSSIADAHIPF